MKNFRILGALLIATVVLFGSCKKDNDDDDNKNGGNGGGGDPTETSMAPTAPENRKVVLEDFTGVRCGYCPDGHVRAKALAKANPGKVFIIAIHSGGYAAPANGWANFTSIFGDPIRIQAAPIGYPAGTINRIIFEDYLQKSGSRKAKIAMSRGAWAIVAPKVFAMSSPVNIGTKATFDKATRKLTVKVDLYYTADETVPNNINVAILQSGLVSKQSGGGNAYVQDHVLRDMMTGQWGKVVTESTTKGSKVSKTFTYDLPEDFNGTDVNGGGAVIIKDLNIVTFVSRGKTEILNATETHVVE